MLAGKAVRKVAIIGGNRIPFARSNSAYVDTSNQDMLTAAIDGLVDRFKLHGEKIDEVAARLQPGARMRAGFQAGPGNPGL